MSKKWFIPLLVSLPFVPALLWGFHLPQGAYQALRLAQQAMAAEGLLPLGIVEFEPLTTPLFPLSVALIAQLGAPPAHVAVLLGTLGWGIAALLVWWFGRYLRRNDGALVAALLFCFNPWIVTTLGQATGWIIALVWLLANFAARKRFVMFVAGVLFLLSLFFHPSQGFSWPVDVLQPLLWSAVLLSAGVGLDWLASTLHERGATPLSAGRAMAALLALLFLLAGGWQSTRLWRQFAARPLSQWAVEEEVAAWLRQHTDGGDTVLANERISYLAGRQRVTAEPQELLATLPQEAPDYVVAGSTLPWQLLRQAIPFRLYYEPVAQFGATNAPHDQKQLFAFRPPAAGQGKVTPLNARVPDRLAVLGYQLQPQPARRGAQTTLTLYLQRAQATLAEMQPFRAVVRLVSPEDGSTVREWSKRLPHSVAAGQWQPGEVIAETIQFPIPADMESGAYRLNLSLVGAEETALWPFSLNNDVNRLDRIPLGYVTLPDPPAPASAAPVSAEFAGGIHLSGAEWHLAQDRTVLDVTLYWEPRQTVEEPYVVFVHLFDQGGNLVANHDAPPANGRFPTDAWLPGLVIHDGHRLALPPALAPGRYELRAGLYDAQTGQRMPLAALKGSPAGGDAVSLGHVTLD